MSRKPRSKSLKARIDEPLRAMFQAVEDQPPAPKERDLVDDLSGKPLRKDPRS